MTTEYGFPLPYVLGTDPRHYLTLEAGLALLEARRERLAPGSVAGHVAHAVARARDAVRKYYEENFTIIHPAPPVTAAADTQEDTAHGR
jgi:hypothetical protein